MNPIKPLLCPFFDNDHNGITGPYVNKSSDKFHDALYQVCCSYCGAMGPVKDTEADAIKEWNCRFSPSIEDVSLDSLRGIAPDATGEKSSEQFVRDIRDKDQNDL